MEIEKTTADNNLSNEEWMLILLMLILEDERQKDETWNQFETELIYKNRFFSDSPIVKEIHKRAAQATTIIPAGSLFYRARVYKQNSFDKLFEYYLKDAGFNREEIRQMMPNLSETEKRFLLLAQQSGDNWEEAVSGTDLSAFTTAIKKWKKNIQFKGYNAKDSAAPPAELTGNGRANPDHIRYLYLAEDKITPIYEVRPIIGDHVSVAKFRLLKEIRIYDMTIEIQDQGDTTEVKFPSLFNTIGRMFSRPTNGNPTGYIPTQYLAEEIKRLGFDGLRFNSSLHKGGVNLVLFNPEDCKPISSELIDVTGIEIFTDDPFVYKIGNRTENTKHGDKR